MYFCQQTTEEQRKMQESKISKKLAILLSLMIAFLIAMVGFGAYSSMSLANAAEGEEEPGESANTTLYDDTNTPMTASVVTVVGDAETIDPTKATLNNSTFLLVTRDTKTTSGYTRLSVNPSASSMSSGAPTGAGILIAFERYIDGDGKKMILYAPYEKAFYETTGDLDEDSDQIMYNMKKVTSTSSLPSGWASLATGVTYTPSTGILQIKDDYTAADITVYNFIKDAQTVKSTNIYGARLEKGTPKSLGSVAFSVKDPKKDTVTWSASLIKSSVKVSNGFSTNVIFSELPTFGGEGSYLGYNIASVRAYAVNLSGGKVQSMDELLKGSDYSFDKTSGSFSLSRSLNVPNVLIVSDYYKSTDAQAPIYVSKNADTLTYQAVEGYKYRLYKKNDDNTYTKLQELTEDDVDDDGNVTFEGLTAGTRYYVSYVRESDGKESKYKLIRTLQKATVENVEARPPFTFAAGEEYSGHVTIGGHWGGVENIQGAEAFGHGHTIFNVTLNSISGGANASGAAELNALFAGKSFSANCITPGAGYSTGMSKGCHVRVLTADEKTGAVGLLIWTTGGWVNGGNYQNIAGNLYSSVEITGRIKISKVAMEEAISESLDEDDHGGNGEHNENYTLAGAVFNVYDAHGGNVDTMETDENGEAESVDLNVADGPFKVVEVKNPDGYEFYVSEGEEYTIGNINLAPGEDTVVEVPEQEETGDFEMIKVSKDPNSEKNPYYSFEGIEYTLVGDNYEKTYVLTLDENGYASVEHMAYDTYTITETKTNKWYQMNTDTYSVTINAETTARGTKTVSWTHGEISDWPQYVWIELDKQTHNPSITKHNAVYQLPGAKYRITCYTPLKEGSSSSMSDWMPDASRAVNEPDIIQTGIDKYDGSTNLDRLNGYGRSVKLLYGDYYVHEVDDAPNYAIDPVTYDVPHTKWGVEPDLMTYDNVSVEDATYHLVQEDRYEGTCLTKGYGDLEDNPDVDFSFKLDKRDDLNESNVGEGKANLSAIFEIRYYAISNPTAASSYDSSQPFDVWYLQTDENGQAVFDDLLETVDTPDADTVPTSDGKYIKVVPGPDGDIYGVGKTYTGNRVEQDKTVPYEYKQNTVNASAGNRFPTIANNDGRIYIKQNTEGEWHAVIPVGIVEIEEVVAPYGYRYESGSLHGRDSNGIDKVGNPYQWNDPGFDVQPTPVVHRIYNPEVTASHENWSAGRFDTRNAEVSVSFPGGAMREHIYRTDVQLQKKRDDNSQTLAYIPFLITSDTTGEQHIIVTDENGFYTSESEKQAYKSQRKGYDHSYNTNYNDLVVDKDGDGEFSEEELNNIDWENLDHQVGTYFYGYGPDKFEGCDPIQDGRELMNDRNMMFKNGKFRDDDGAFPYDSYTARELRVPNNENLSLLIVPFTVVNDSQLVTHDIDDVPVSLHTQAGTDQGPNVGTLTGKTVKITDEITYAGLTPNMEYTMIGRIMVPETEEPILDDEGNEITAEQDFVASKDGTGSVVMEFEVPTSAIKTTSIVVFERCVAEGVVIAVHEDPEDDNQTINFTEIHTTATDSVTEDHYGQVMNETITVIDKVECKGLSKGATYTLSGMLMDKATGEPLQDENGTNITATTTFKAEKSEMTVELSFDVPRSCIAGKTIVAFEDLYNEGKEIAKHHDLDDEDQTVYYPDVHTTATDNTTGLHIGLAEDDVTIDDVVEYDNLIEGATYELFGQLMDKETGEAIEGATAWVKFIARDGKAEVLEGDSADPEDEEATEGEKDESAADEADEKDAESDDPEDEGDDESADPSDENADAEDEGDEGDEGDKATDEGNEAVEGDEEDGPTHVSGEVLVRFKVSREMVEGKTTVVFEELQYEIGTAPDSDSENPKAGEKIPVAEHKDLDDEGQTVFYPEIHTLAFAGDDVNLDQVLPALEQIKEFWDQIPNTDAGYLEKFRTARILNRADGEFAMSDLLALFDRDQCAERNFNTDPVTYDEVMGLLNAPTYTLNPLFSSHNRRAQVDTFTNMVTFSDTIEYTNLLIGEEYVAEGTIMDKETGEAVKDPDTGEEIKATTEFKAEERDGYVVVEFTFDARAIGLDFTQITEDVKMAKDIVVFEDLYLKGNGVEDELILVGQHADLADEYQTMPLGNFPADELFPETMGETGDTALVTLAVIIAANAIAFGYAYRRRRKAGIA